jgi:hypothetical protein
MRARAQVSSSFARLEPPEGHFSSPCFDPRSRRRSMQVSLIQRAGPRRAAAAADRRAASADHASQPVKPSSSALAPRLTQANEARAEGDDMHACSRPQWRLLLRVDEVIPGSRDIHGSLAGSLVPQGNAPGPGVAALQSRLR